MLTNLYKPRAYNRYFKEYVFEQIFYNRTLIITLLGDEMFLSIIKDKVYKQIQDEKVVTSAEGKFNFRFDYASANSSLIV